MGGSSDDDPYYEPPARQGPPPEQIMPGRAPPPVPSFLPSQAGQMAQFGQGNIDAINSYDAALRQQIEEMYRPQQPEAGAGAGAGAATDPEAARALLALALASAAEENGRAPMNRAGGRMPWDEETGGYMRNPDWRPGHRAGMRASSPGWGGSLAGKLV